MFSGESLVFGFPNAEKVGLHQLGSAYPSSSSNTPSSFYSPSFSSSSITIPSSSLSFFYSPYSPSPGSPPTSPAPPSTLPSPVIYPKVGEWGKH